MRPVATDGPCSIVCLCQSGTTVSQAKGRTDWGAIWEREGRLYVWYGGAHWHHLVNTVEWFVRGSDAVVCQITLATRVCWTIVSTEMPVGRGRARLAWTQQTMYGFGVHIGTTWWIQLNDSFMALLRSYVRFTELCILWSELSQCKLSPTLATTHYSSHDHAIGLVAQCELSGYVKLG